MGVAPVGSCPFLVAGSVLRVGGGEPHQWTFWSIVAYPVRGVVGLVRPRAILPTRLRLKLITLPWELEVPTLSLASLAAVTPDRFDIAIVDLLRERLDLDEPVDLVGISASTPRIKAAYALADLYRARGVKVVLGGHHATALPYEALGHADAVVRGEGEASWRAICDQMLSNPDKVGGIYAEPAPDLASLPQPRVDLMKIERYGAFYYPVIASRGCPEACSFCFAKRMTAGYRTYPIAHVLEQVRRRPKFVRALYFVDDNLPADPDHSRELFRQLARWKVPFGMQARHEFSADEDNLQLAKAAGCVLISSGYESVNQSSLDKVGKRAEALGYKQAIANIFKAGILPSGNWMFGFDWDTPDTFERTLAFMDDTDLMHASLTCEIPFPGTQAWKRYDKEGRLLSYDYDRYRGKDHVVVRPKQMSATQLQEGIRWLAKQFYAPTRALARARRAYANPRLDGFGQGLLKATAFAALQGFQVWQWHYRMVPSLYWLYLRLIGVNKYRYFRDYLRGSNFWATDHAPAGPVEPTPVPPVEPCEFMHNAGFKSRRSEPLRPDTGQSALVRPVGM